MASCTMPKRKDLIETWTDWISEPLPQEKKCRKEINGIGEEGTAFGRLRWNRLGTEPGLLTTKNAKPIHLIQIESCAGLLPGPGGAPPRPRRPAPRRKSAPTAPAAGSDLRDGDLMFIVAHDGLVAQAPTCPRTSSGRRPPPSSRRAEARVKPGDAAAALESCCTFSSCSLDLRKHEASTDLFFFFFCFCISFFVPDFCSLLSA
jgi:hypothetical protein